MRPYYDEAGIDVYYDDDRLLENVYDDRELDEDENEDVTTWQQLKQRLGGKR